MQRQRIYCVSCRAGQICGGQETLDLLRANGMLRRQAEPDEGLVNELLRAALPTMPCPECGAGGLAIDENFVDQSGQWDEWEEWEQGGRGCEQCRKIIPAERLELYPQATRCAACEAAPRSTNEDVEYCPRCGSIMTLRTTASGVTQYRLYCPECKR